MRTCLLCQGPITEPGVPAEVLTFRTRAMNGRPGRTMDTVCRDCAADYRLHRAGGHDGKTAIRVLGNVDVSGMTEHACEGCGYRVLLAPDKRRKRFFCSDRCRVRAHRESNVREPVTDRACDGCGTTFSPARSDAKYCSPACRQRAHRDRNRYVYDPSRIGEWKFKGGGSQMQMIENTHLSLEGAITGLDAILPGSYETDFDPEYAAELKRDMLKQLATIRRYLKRLPD